MPVIQWSAGEPFDASGWTFERGFLRNSEAQYYAGNSDKNFEVRSDGVRLIARAERVPNAAFQPGSRDWRRSEAEAKYTSASIVSKDAWQNFKIEIVANIHGSNGFWPAIWLRGQNARGFGEIDIMEHIGREPNTVHATVHYGVSLDNLKVEKADREIANLDGKNVRYAAEVTPRAVTVTVDGALMLTIKRDVKAGAYEPLRQPFSLVLNVALGGAWSGPIDDRALPAVMTIKSIRIWELQPDWQEIAVR